jgi:CubicO group peptidase (beta-lactamase class C family)/D-alanyl-D-alanine dipeptidase
MRPRLRFAVLAAVVACAPADRETIPPDARYADAVAALETVIAQELREKRLPSITVALVDDQQIVWARGFGTARTADSTPATAMTIHRVGSVSKLFTDIGIMQLAERGEIDIDAPVTTYLPEFSPGGDGAAAITLRHLMSHRAGLMREPPVGNYFDPAGSTLRAMVESLNDRDLVYEPGTRAKYSNAGIGVVGYVLEVTQRQPFAQFLRQSVLEPMGLQASSFEPTPETSNRLASAIMWTRDGREFAAPTFELGMTPAGSMYSSVLDLGRFLSVLFAGGRAGGRQVLRAETLEQMLTPQFAQPGQRNGYGLGFALGELDGRRLIGHGGAIYGFATSLAALPDDKLGAVVIVTADVANAVSDHIAETALRLMVAAKNAQPLPPVALSQAIEPLRARQLAGRYARLEGPDSARFARSGVRGDEGVPFIDLVARGGRLFLETESTNGLRAVGDTLMVDDRLAIGPRLVPLDSARIVFRTDTLVRVPVPRPTAPPARWDGLIGEYGWDHNTLYILEKNGKLHALIEWFFEYPLEEMGGDVFRFPQSGLYDNEFLVFSRGADGLASQVEAAGVVFARRDVGTAAGTTFRITPVRSVEELRREALAATPPAETGDFVDSDLVELAPLDARIRYDIRYATTDNFMGAIFYPSPHAFLQRPAAEATARALSRLAAQGYGVLIHDAYRPWYVTRMFWDATPADMKQFVANPAQGSRHNRGAAVDLTLYELASGRPVRMPSGYDEFSPRAFPDYPGGTSLERWQRDLLRAAMEAEGFTVYEWEWWHYDFDNWRRYRIGTLPFDSIR